MVTFVVRNTNDSGTGSLRQAVIDANASASADTIVFDAALAGRTIVLTGGELALADDVTIDGDVNGDNKADITISGNNASRIFNINGAGTDAALLSLTMTAGNAGPGPTSGGAVFGTGGASTLLLQDSTILNSIAGFGGGLATEYMATRLVNVTMSGNYATRGGAIYAVYGTLTATNMTIDENQAAEYGGGLHVNGTSVTVSNSTITENTAGSTKGGGIYQLGTIGPVTLVNSVVAENRINGGSAANDVSGSIASATNSAFGTTVTITADHGGNLQNVASTGLGILQDNGGTVATRNITTSDSPLFNAGSNAGIPPGTTLDANGQARTGDGTVDIGATEFSGPLVVTTASDVVNANDGLLSLREAVAIANAAADADTITFAANLAGQTITLTSGELSITTDVTIDGDVNGDNKADITISGNDDSRIFNISGAQTDVDILSLTLTHGFGGVGGALTAKNTASLDIADTTFSNNRATNSGGALNVEGVFSVTVTNSTITENSAAFYGGGIYAAGGTVTVTNSTIDGNSSGTLGGALSTDQASLTFINTTITGNHGATGNGGIDNISSTLTVINSVIAQNTAGPGYTASDAGGATAIATATNSVFGSDVTITTATNVRESVTNIGLGGLQDNGGTVQTRSILMSGSPLFNAGSNAGVPPGVTTDANGHERIGDGTVDIGATEFTGPLVVTTASDVVDANDGLLSLREAVEIANGGADADTITFDASLAGLTITLTGGELALTDDVTIDGDTDGDNKADITISGNDASRIFNISGLQTDVDVLSLTLTHGYSGIGGAIYAFYTASLDIADTTFSNNRATNGGGAFEVVTVNSVTVTNSTITENSAGIYGGGFYAFQGAITITNSTIDGNSSGKVGGALSTAQASLTFINTTITGNHAATAKGGIDNLNSTLTVINSVIAQNTAGPGYAASDAGGTIATATNSVFGSDVTITAATNVQKSVTNIGLGTLQDNGGTVQTRSILTSGSPLFNAGSNAGVPPGVTTDANGHERIGDGTVDIGAAEFTGPLVVTTASDVVNANDGVLSLREAVALANAGGDADTITFAASLAGQTITLTGGELALTTDITVDGDTSGDNKADITISGNNASRIFNISGAATDAGILSLTLTNGSATNGAAILASGAASLHLTDSTIRNSLATASGGGLQTIAVGALTISNSTIQGNTSDGFGGGLYIQGGTATITNSTIHGNSAGTNGGALSTGSATLNLLSTTITANHAGASGGGIENYASTLSVTNSVVAENTATTAGSDVLGNIAFATNSVFGSDITALYFTNLQEQVSNIGLGALQDNGGTVATRNILDGSPLLNAGSNAGLPGGLTQDANGALRIFGGTVDIGATELQDQAPVITSNGGGATASITIAENGTAVTTVTSSDPDAGATKLFTISGADAALFAINSATGVLTFKSAPNFEAPADAGGNNVYDVTVKVTDGTLTDTQAIAVTVTNQNEAPVITSNGGGATAQISIAENGTAVTTVTSSDPDAGAAKTFSISGADAALFAINSATGVLAFKSAPDFETPADSGANNVYDVTVSVSDGTLTDSQAIAVTVTNQTEAPVITSNGGGATASISIAENGTAVTSVTASGPDAGTTRTITLGGADAARFAINSATGVLTFLAAPDFETPADHGGDNVYNVTVLVTDGALSDSQDIAVTVTNLAGVVITGSAKADTVTSTKTVAGQPLPTGEEDQINGRGGDDILNGLGGNDRLKGGANDDTLKGGAGADRLGGGSGADLLIGGSGNDVMTGDAGTDRLKGGSGDDRLIGGKGIDKLAGNGGADVFVLTNKAADHDIIAGFVHAADSLEISAAKFGGGLTAGHALAARAFVSNATGEAGDANDRFIFDTATKELFFDADGTGSTAAILIATFTGPNPHLGADDVLIV